MAECKKRLFSVITAHTAFTDAPKRKVMRCQVHNGVVDTASAKRKFPQYSFFILPAGSKKIERQRLFLFFQLFNCLNQCFYRFSLKKNVLRLSLDIIARHLNRLPVFIPPCNHIQ